MRAILMAAAAVVAISAVPAQAQTKVTVNGCVSGGVESASTMKMGCLIIRDRASTQSYQINAAKPQPDPAKGLVVHLTGTVKTGGVDVCMQGPVLENIKWNYTRMKCQGK